MNIYIFGSRSFSSNIVKTLYRQGIQEKLDAVSRIDDDFGRIIKISYAKEFKDIMSLHSDDLFIIDDKKILYHDFFSTLFSLFRSKNIIDIKFLENSKAIVDVKFHDVASIAQYVFDRIDTKTTNTIRRKRR